MREDYQELIDAVSESLGTPATLESRDFALIAFAAHETDDDRVMDPVRTRSILRRGSPPAVRAWFESFGITRADRPVRIPPEPTAGVNTGRICLPARYGGVVYGYIWLLDEGALDLDDPRLTDAGRHAEHAGALLADEARAGARRGDLLHALLTAAPAALTTAADALATALGGPGAGGPLAMVAVAPWTGASAGPPTPGAVPAEPATAPAAAAGRLGGVSATTVVVAGRQPPTLAVLVRLRATDTRTDAAVTVAERLVAARTEGGGGSPVAGVSTAVDGPDGLPRAWHQACGAALAARAEGRLGPVARWDRIGPYRMLTALPAGAADPAAARLLEPAHRDLALTAESYLDHAGQAAATAATLGIHRQTLYYRLSRVTQLTGLDLADGGQRLLLHMTLKTARLHAATEHGH